MTRRTLRRRIQTSDARVRESGEDLKERTLKITHPPNEETPFPQRNPWLLKKHVREKLPVRRVERRLAEGFPERSGVGNSLEGDRSRRIVPFIRRRAGGRGQYALQSRPRGAVPLHGGKVRVRFRNQGVPDPARDLPREKRRAYRDRKDTELVDIPYGGTQLMVFGRNRKKYHWNENRRQLTHQRNGR